MKTIPLEVLLEALECLKLIRSDAPPGTYYRLVNAQFELDEVVRSIIKDQTVEVTQ